MTDLPINYVLNINEWANTNDQDKVHPRNKINCINN